MLSRAEKFAVFSPLVLYLGYVLYLVFLSPKPFLIRWLEGCFAFFLALVFCNIIRKNLVGRQEDSGEVPAESADPHVDD